MEGPAGRSTSEAVACRPHRDVTGQIVEPAEHDLAAVLEPGVRLETRGGTLSDADPQLAQVPGSPSRMRPARACVRHVAPGTSLLALRTAQTMASTGVAIVARTRRLSDPPRPTQQNLERQ